MLRSIIFTCLLSTSAYGATNKKNWSYTVLSSFVNTSDLNRLEIAVDVTKMGRAEYVASGSIDVKVPIDDNYKVGVNLYRSSTGVNSRYKLMPLRIQNQHFSSIMNGAYREYIMDYVKDCSNAPQFKDKWVNPHPVKRVTFDKCKVSIEKLPNQMPPGYYKIVIAVQGPENFQAYIIFFVQIETTD